MPVAGSDQDHGRRYSCGRRIDRLHAGGEQYRLGNGDGGNSERHAAHWDGHRLEYQSSVQRSGDLLHLQSGSELQLWESGIGRSGNGARGERLLGIELRGIRQYRDPEREQ